MNVLVALVYLLLTFILTTLCYKFYGKNGLYIWICVNIIISNIQTVKISEFMGLTTSLGNISYASIFLATDIINEKYGIEANKLGVKLSFIIMCIFSILMTLFLQFEPSKFDTSQDALNVIFGYIPRITLSSLTAYFISQTFDAYAYAYLKRRFNILWLSNNGSTFMSQTVDTFIFTTLAFIGTMPISEMLEIMVTMLIFKYIIAILDTPFMYIVKNIKKVNEL